MLTGLEYIGDERGVCGCLKEGFDEDTNLIELPLCSRLSRLLSW